MKTVFIALIGMCVSAPALAQAQPVLILDFGSEDRVVVTASRTLEQRIEDAAETACERPFIRDLKGWVMYHECLAEVRTEIAEKLAESAEKPATLALR